ncbi:MAG: Rpn family recombination-promoting nuclease/putative transposase [Candidatus Desantisbacteria bacterium]
MPYIVPADEISANGWSLGFSLSQMNAYKFHKEDRLIMDIQRNTEEKRLIRFDWAAKHILRDKSNFDILEGFLTALLGKDIRIIHLLESESNQEHESNKFNKVDLLTVDDKGEYIIIEIQNEREVHYIERLLFGTSKLIVENLKLGEGYKDIKKVISISILYFTLGEKIDDYVYYGSTEFRGIHTNSALKLRRKEKETIKTIETRQICPEYYLIEVERFEDIIQSDLDEWIYFLKHESIKDDFKSKNIKKMQEKLDVLRMDEKDRKSYESYLMNLARENDMMEGAREDGITEGIAEGMAEGMTKGMKKGMAKGMAEGMAKGKVEGKVEGMAKERVKNAKNMLKFGMRIEDIVKITGLTIDEIEEVGR